MIPFFRAALLALPFFAAGCAGLSPAPPAQPRTVAARTYRQAIDISGRLSVRYQQNGRDEALHGSFEWRQRPGHTELTLLSPLGQTLALIDITPAGSTLTQAGQAPVSATDADALAAETLGWPLPVSGLRDWLQGYGRELGGKRFIATPADPDADIVTDDGWRLHYAGWDTAGVPRPRRIDLQRSTIQAGEVALRLVIDTYQPY
jgi:outer membrane lipoprotein LolB